MATIESQLTADAGTATALQRVNDALSKCAQNLWIVKDAMSKAMDTSIIDSAYTSLERSNTAISRMADNLRRVAEQQDRVNTVFSNASKAVEGIEDRVNGIMASDVFVYAAGAMDMSDAQSNLRTRMEFIASDGESVTELEAKVASSARKARIAYADFVSAVVNLSNVVGDSFSGSDEIIRFSRLSYQGAAASGASAQEQQGAVNLLTQAMASGGMSAGEYNMLAQSAPILAGSIEEYMRSVIGAQGAVEQWAAQGLITAQVIKEAMLGSAEDIESRLGQIPRTWGQVWTATTDIAARALDPVLGVVGMLADNIEIIGPLVLGLGAAFGVFQLAANWTRTATAVSAAYNAVITLISIGYGVLTGSTAAATRAATTFNSVLLANPITWIVMGVFVLIGALYAAVGAYNKFTDSAVSATGLVAGAVMSVAAGIGNLMFGIVGAFYQFFLSIFAEPVMGMVDFVMNVVNGGFTSIAGAAANLIGQVISWFLSLFKVVTAIVDALLGSEVTDWLTDMQNKVTSWGKNETALSVDRASEVDWQLFDYGEAWGKGYDWGEGLGGKISGLSDFDTTDMGGLFDYSGMPGSGAEIFGYTEGIGGLLGGDSVLGGMEQHLEEIAGNTGSAANSLKDSPDKFAQMREGAERDAMNRPLTLVFNTDMSEMTNSIGSNMDIDGVVSRLTGKLVEMAVAVAQGVHI